MRVIVTLLFQAELTRLQFQLRDKIDGLVLAHGHISSLGKNPAGKSAFIEITTDDEPYVESVHYKTHREAIRGLIDFLHRNSHIESISDITTVIHNVPYGSVQFANGACALAISHNDALARSKLMSELMHIPRIAPQVVVLDAALRILSSARHIIVFGDSWNGMLLQSKDV